MQACEPIPQQTFPYTLTAKTLINKAFAPIEVFYFKVIFSWLVAYQLFNAPAKPFLVPSTALINIKG